MTQQQDYEYVSAAMDGEAAEEEWAALLQDEHAQKKWHEYHVIRDSLSRHRPVSVETAAAATVIQPRAANSVFKGFAVAASLMAVAVIAWQCLPATMEAEPAATAAVTDVKEAADTAIVPVSGSSLSAVPNAAPQDVVVPHAARANEPVAEIKPAMQVGENEQSELLGADAEVRVQ